MVPVMAAIEAAIRQNIHGLDICGFISRDKTIYPLGTDTKVLSTVFELTSRPSVVRCAAEHGYKVIEPTVQNHYPDFTLVPDDGRLSYIAIDVKTTYRDSAESRFGFTLGGYTSFIREATAAKNIVFPYDHYTEHWIIGFVYTRAGNRAAAAHTFTVDSIDEIVTPYTSVDFFVAEKWKIAGDRAGSGNTTNIGSILGTMDEFRRGAGPFASEAEFLSYWRAYGRTKALRTFSNLAQFRAAVALNQL